MDGNSPKHPETADACLSAMRVLRAWLDREGGNQKIPQILDLLAERTIADLTAGHAPPALDAETLRTLYCDAHGGIITDQTAGRWLPRSAVTIWWGKRRDAIDQTCRDSHLLVAPDLVVLEGGGRGNTTQYRFDFQLLPVLEGSAALPAAEAASADLQSQSEIRYVMETARAAWWLRLLIGAAPFPMRSWRGYALVGSMAVGFLLLCFWWCVIVNAMNVPRSLTARDLLSVTSGLLLSIAWWKSLKPIVRLPNHRVTIAPDLSLAWNQFYGQFRLTRDAKSKTAGGWFSLVRHWGYCPICSGEVEILSGGEAFPGRLVGRCADSPLEHVFSFDPVSLTGKALVD